jgi:hypothetical protein
MSMDCESIMLKPAKNGFIVCYREKYKSPTAGPYDSMQYKEVKEVFTSKESNKAIARVAELYKKAGGEMEGEEEESD